MNTHPFEPFRIKVTEPLNLNTRETRLNVIKKAKYNLFRVPSNEIWVDLLTDSGTGAMSQEQWAGLMRGDESYAGARSFERFLEAVRLYTGKKHVIPCHQGRAGEKIIAQTLIKPGNIVVSNTFFDTTIENFRFAGGKAIEVPSRESSDLYSDFPFKGNADTQKLEEVIKNAISRGLRVSLFTMTVTNNTRGGQPVSIKNIKETKEILSKYGVLFHIDACRASENAYFIKLREPGYEDKPVGEIVREMLSYADIVTMSAKKDGLSNIGGFIATDDDELAKKFGQYLVLWEGFLTYGGIAGRDLEAIAIGLIESLDEDYLRYRIGQVFYLAESLKNRGIPVLWPPGGHAVYVDAGKFLSHIPSSEFPGQALAVALYIEGGVRSVELGSLMFGKEREVKHELVRLAIPRRVYTQSHLDHVSRTFALIEDMKHELRGFKIVYEPEYLRHFLVDLEPLGGPYS